MAGWWGASGERGGVLQTHTITADITYPDCQGHLNIGRDKTQHRQRNRRLSMAAIPHGVELLSSGNVLCTLVAFSQLKEQKQQSHRELAALDGFNYKVQFCYWCQICCCSSSITSTCRYYDQVNIWWQGSYLVGGILHRPAVNPAADFNDFPSLCFRKKWPFQNDCLLANCMWFTVYTRIHLGERILLSHITLIWTQWRISGETKTAGKSKLAMNLLWWIFFPVVREKNIKTLNILL